MTNLTPSVFTQEVAAILRAARARRNVAQQDLADAIDVSQSQLSKMLRGLRPITIDQLDILCEMLEIGLLDVIREADEETESRAGHNKVVMRVRNTNAQRIANGAAPYRDDLLVVSDWSQTAPVAVPKPQGQVAETERMRRNRIAHERQADRPDFSFDDPSIDQVFDEIDAELGNARSARGGAKTGKGGVKKGLSAVSGEVPDAVAAHDEEGSIAGEQEQPQEP